MRRFWSCLLVLGVLLAGNTAASAAEPTDAPRPLYWHVDPDGDDGSIDEGAPVARSRTTISRSEDGIRFKIRTTGLTEGHGYTVWFFSYDNPDVCLGAKFQQTHGARCTLFDLFFNPAARGSLMWGRSGKFVKSDGLTRFSGYRPRNDVPCATEPAVVTDECSGVLLGRGLAEPMTAEIHFVLRDHGPDQPDVDDETTTINGGCDPETNAGMPVYGPGWGHPGNFACFDPQGN